MAYEKEQTTIRLPEELKNKLVIEAEEKGLSLNALLLIIFDKYFDNQ